MKKIYLTVDEVVSQTPHLIREQEDVLVINVADKTGMVYGKPEFVNLSACNNLGIATMQANYDGGGVVFLKGDLNIMCITKGWNHVCEDLLALTRDFLVANGVDADIAGNDLIVYKDGESNKIGSYASVWYGNNLVQGEYHISMSVDIGLIEKICLKPMVKVPTGLKDYLDIDAENILEHLETYIDELR